MNDTTGQVREIVETFINGNRTDAVQAIINAPSTLAAAILACDVYGLLRENYSKGEAASFLRAMDARI